MNNVLNRDAEFCGKVPLNQTNLVQPHGYLLILKAADLSIAQVSENVSELLGKPVQEIVQSSLEQFLSAEEIGRVRDRFARPVSGRIPFEFRFAEKMHLSTIKRQDELLILEVEKEIRGGEQSLHFTDVYLDLKYVMAAIDEAQTADEVCRVFIRELKKISGFDKIMIYRFDENWNGDVIAEEKEEGMDQYLGLKFPASDVPRQARELYKRTPFRLIPNVDYEPVRLYPVINPVTGGFTDLSDSNLRSVAGVHLEYLRNMKVTASMSTRIVVNNELWGLIACHHRTPKYLSFDLCSVFELLSSVLSARLAGLLNQDVFRYRHAMQQVHAGLVEEVYSSGAISEGIRKNISETLALLKADGLAFALNGHIEGFGSVPAGSELEDLMIWLQSNGINRLYQQPALSSVYEPAGSFAKEASGVLVLPIQPDRGHYILAFRPEVISQVNWGGNPNEAVQFEADGKKYHPRASFQQWREQVTQTAVPWKPEELDVAEQFRNFVVEYTLNNQS